jgi:hypothetical protein
MPSTLQKTRKQISKKRGGEVNALHAKSRDSMRLNKAGIRDQRLGKLASSRGKREQPIGMQPRNEIHEFQFISDQYISGPCQVFPTECERAGC